MSRVVGVPCRWGTGAANDLLREGGGNPLLQALNG